MARRPLGRVESRRTFAALRKSSNRGKNGPVQVTFAPLVGERQVKVAYAVSKQCGGAVERNRIRRRLRSAATEFSSDLPSGAYLVRTDPTAADASYSELAHSLKECFQKVSRKSKEETA